MTTPTGILFSDPQAQPLSTTGQPQAGAYYLFYLTGTTTPANVYADGLLTTPLSQTPGASQPSCTADSAGRFNPIYLAPGTVYRVQLYNASNVKREDTDPYVPVSAAAPTAAQVGAALYPVIAAETTVGATVVNQQYPYFCVDRYVTNSTPGTTDTTSAWNYATAAAIINGGLVTYGATGLYLVSGPINCTVTGGPNNPGITIQGLGNGGEDFTFGVLAKHTGVAVFDCTGNNSITFRDVSIKTDTTTYPKTGILTARNNSGESNLTRLFNVKIAGRFSVACYYNYGSEDDGLFGCYFANYATTAGTKVACITSNNIASLTSPFTTIATGGQSCIDHNYVGCQFLNVGGTTTSDAIYIESSDSVKIFGGWAGSAAGTAANSTATSAVGTVMTVGGSITGTFAVGQQIYGTGVPIGTVITSLGTGSGGAGTYNISTSGGWSSTFVNAGLAGRALVYVDMTNSASNFCSIIGLSGEVSQPLSQYGILFSNNSVTPTGWQILGVKLVNGLWSLAAAGSNPTMDNFHVDNIPTTGSPSGGGGGLSWPGTVQNSTLNTGYALTIGTSSKNNLVGDTSSWTITTRSHDSWTETGVTNRTFAPGVSNGVNGWTVVGALTQRAKLAYNSNKADFTILLQGATSIAAAASATIALPFSVTDNATATVVDTSAGTVLCTALLNGSTLTILGGFTTNAHLICIQGFGFVS